jgi:hypothetical protein
MNKSYYIVVCLLGVCLSSASAYGDESECFVEHNILCKGKEISFALPCWYTNENIAEKFYLPQYVDNYNVKNKEFVFFSTKNDNCYFTFSIVDLWSEFKNLNDEALLDSIMTDDEQNYFYMNPFRENLFISQKKRTEDNQVYCSYIALRKNKTFIYNEERDSLILSDDITSTSCYITRFDTKIYFFTFFCIESMQEFSYEEKRRILESIKIR